MSAFLAACVAPSRARAAEAARIAYTYRTRRIHGLAPSRNCLGTRDALLLLLLLLLPASVAKRLPSVRPSSQHACRHARTHMRMWRLQWRRGQRACIHAFRVATHRPTAAAVRARPSPPLWEVIARRPQRRKHARRAAICIIERQRFTASPCGHVMLWAGRCVSPTVTLARRSGSRPAAAHR